MASISGWGRGRVVYCGVAPSTAPIKLLETCVNYTVNLSGEHEIHDSEHVEFKLLAYAVVSHTGSNGWWFKRGRALCIESKQPVASTLPSIITVGCGRSIIMGWVRVVGISRVRDWHLCPPRHLLAITLLACVHVVYRSRQTTKAQRNDLSGSKKIEFQHKFEFSWPGLAIQIKGGSRRRLTVEWIHEMEIDAYSHWSLASRARVQLFHQLGER